jgi:molecular chaperone Hsp33
MEEFVEGYRDLINNLFDKHYDDTEVIVNQFESCNFNYLGSKEVKFHCPCSKNRMMTNLLNLHHNDLEEVFADDNELEIRCDYCNNVYNISKADLNDIQ